MRRVIWVGILLLGMSVTAEGVMEVEEPVTVVDGDHLNVVFTVPDATSWSWKLTATAGSDWRHIDGTQVPSYGDWVPHGFSGNPGYWKSATVDDNSPWRNFQQPFHGKLSPVGEGEGPGEPYIGEYDIDAVTDSEYFVLPTINYVCAGKEVTLTAYSEPVQDPDNPPPTVNSTWEINKTDGITPDPFPDGHSVTFTASEPDEYTVKGESTSDTELTDSATLNVVKVEIDVDDVWVIPAKTDWPDAHSEMTEASTLTITITTDPPGFEDLVTLEIDRVEPLEPATGSGTLTRHESDVTIWYYEAFAESKTLKHPVAKKPYFLAKINGVEVGTEHITVSPVFRHLSFPMLGIYTQDRESAWRYARWKYDIDTSDLDSISYNASLSERGKTVTYITGGNYCELGPAAFTNMNPDSGENLCASTLGHENVHGGQTYTYILLFYDCSEAEGYIWELNNASHTGISEIDYDDIEEKYNYHSSQCN